jgi:hypothetical protein
MRWSDGKCGCWKIYRPFGRTFWRESSLNNSDWENIKRLILQLFGFWTLEKNYFSNCAILSTSLSSSFVTVTVKRGFLNQIDWLNQKSLQESCLFATNYARDYHSRGVFTISHLAYDVCSRDHQPFCCQTYRLTFFWVWKPQSASNSLLK